MLWTQVREYRKRHGVAGGADRDLEQASASQSAGRHEWACVAAQQAAPMPIRK